MPLWSIGEWRARIGSSWCALGRPFKTNLSSHHGAGRLQRVLTQTRVVTMILLPMMFIGINLGLRTLLTREYHHSIMSEPNVKSCGTRTTIFLICSLNNLVTVIDLQCVPFSLLAKELAYCIHSCISMQVCSNLRTVPYFRYSIAA